MRMTKEGHKWISQVIVQFEVTKVSTELKKGKAKFWLSFEKVFWSCWGSVGPMAKQLFCWCFAKTFFVLVVFRKICFGRVLLEFCNSEHPLCHHRVSGCQWLPGGHEHH